MYKKIVYEGCILGVSEVEKNGNITEDDYNRLSAIINNMPVAPDGYYYVLRDDTEEWELIEMPHDVDIDDSEALSIMLGEEE